MKINDLPGLLRHSCLGILHEKRFNELVQIAIHYGVNVCALRSRPMVIDHSVRLEDITADLRSPFDLLFVALYSVLGSLLNLQLKLIDFAFKHHHCPLLVL